MRTLTTNTNAQLTADSRAPRYLLRIAFPSGTVNLTTGKPVTLSSVSYTHTGVSVSEISDTTAQLTFLQGQTPFAADFGDVDSLGVTVEIDLYYELPASLTLIAADVVPKFAGVILNIQDGESTATVQCGQVDYTFPPTRFNAAGGYNYISQPGVLTMGNAKVYIQRNGLS